MSTAEQPIVKKHTRLEDVQAVLLGTMIIALGVNLYTHSGLLTGGSAGLAFLMKYATPLSFGQAFFLINLPFYALAIMHFGWEFTIKTFLSVFSLSVFADVTPMLVNFNEVNPLYASIAGGFLMGVGFLMLFRHNASLGGLNILARYLAEKYGISMGKFQMAVDCMIVLMSVFIVDYTLILISVVGAVALNMIIAVNHKPGRYMGNV
ncbi:putative 5xTM membrane YitT family protein [Marinomonas alcarazii]|uniref:Putative 5xTM membrane YitT family protein n=1 Tax=Marinomonas alcarazii TaxID=491949 RepID=A0A318VI55_9GAMM|nr:YitT family protein [Marinomonas alcarazii]PYF83499.1 putative 5xTM membrane YitT family protein [Marinomonas alcarazii]